MYGGNLCFRGTNRNTSSESKIPRLGKCLCIFNVIFEIITDLQKIATGVNSLLALCAS